MIDYKVERVGQGFDEYLAFKKSRAVLAAGVKTETVSAGKEVFLENKRNQSRERSEQRRIERMKKEQAELEAELDRVTEELYGSAATNYLRAAELETRKTEIEDRLMEIYEELE